MSMHLGLPGLTLGGGSGGAGVDDRPDAFSFTDVTDAGMSLVYTSDAIVVAGIAVATSIGITGGTYSINGGAYTSAAGTVVATDSVTVRVTSSAAASTAASAVLTIGGVSDTYSVTTYAFQAETVALVARMVTPDTATVQFAKDAAIVSLKAAGLWTTLIGLTVHDGTNQQAKLLNWKGATYTPAIVGSVANNDGNFQGDGSTGYLDPGFAFPAGQQNDAHIGFWSLDAGQGTAVDMGSTNTLLLCRNTSNLAAHRVHASASTTPANSDGSGHFVTTRDGSANTNNKAYRNGVLLSGSTTTSIAPEGVNIRILGRGGVVSFSTRRCFLAHWGTAWTAQNDLDFYNIFLTYRTAVSAAA